MQILLSVLLEVGLVPATSLQPKGRGRQLLLQPLGTAGGTLDQWGIADLLQGVQFMAAIFTTIGINGHGMVFSSSL